MIDQRTTYCRGCRTETPHHRFRWEGWWGVQMFFTCFGWCWLCWAGLVPVALLLGLIDRLRPFHCAHCGRRTWGRGRR